MLMEMKIEQSIGNEELFLTSSLPDIPNMVEINKLAYSMREKFYNEMK